jgi:hypothetical protein
MAIRSLKSGIFSRSAMVGNTLIYPGSYESIASVDVGAGGSSTITFSSIPSTYTHLQIRLIGRTNRSTAAIDQMNIRFNSDSGSNYITNHYIQGNGTSVFAGANTSGTLMTVYRLTADGAPTLSGAFGTSVIDILDYANTNKNKTLRALSGQDMNTVNGEVFFVSAAWMSTTAVNSITITPNVGTLFNQYSSFALYGVN